MTGGWFEDDLGMGEYEARVEKGDSWYVSGDDDAPARVVRRPIGFMRRKPIVRVKAWTAPVVKET